MDSSRLDNLVKRRAKLDADVQRVSGRLEAARQELASVEAECAKKGVDPTELDSTIEKLEKRYGQILEEVETQLDKAEEDLQPFLKV